MKKFLIQNSLGATMYAFVNKRKAEEKLKELKKKYTRTEYQTKTVTK